eukprot:1148614-Pelagomonas_calceolata.AAC.1
MAALSVPLFSFGVMSGIQYASPDKSLAGEVCAVLKYSRRGQHQHALVEEEEKKKNSSWLSE